MSKFDLVVRNGFVVDGSGNPWFKADVGVKGEKIAEVGDLSHEKAEKDLDARGLIVSPGFVDIHTHSDYLPLADPFAGCRLMQGITTDVAGSCGTSAAPIGERWWTSWMARKADELWKAVPRRRATEIFREWGIDLTWGTLAEYLDRLEKKGIAINYAQLVGNLTLRAAVNENVNVVKVADEELEEMKTLLTQAMKDGAFGLSSKHAIHTPGFMAESGRKFQYFAEDEIIELCKVVARYGGVYHCDTWRFGRELLEGVKQAIDTCEKVGIATTISHLPAPRGIENWGKAETVLMIIEEARKRGVQIGYDVGLIPPTDTAHELSMLLPEYTLKEKGFPNILRNPETRRRVKEEMWSGRAGTNQWAFGRTNTVNNPFWMDEIKIVYCERNRDFEGKTIAEISRSMGLDPYDTVLDLIADYADPKGFIFGRNWSEKDFQKVLSHPAVLGIESDGIWGAQKLQESLNYPAPRFSRNFWAPFPRLFGYYVRKKKFLPLEDAIRKSTWGPAQFMGIRDRGLIKEGCYADVVIFDFQKIEDNTKDIPPKEVWSEPTKGIEYVLVNGQLVLEKYKHTGALPGKVLRHRATT